MNMTWEKWKSMTRTERDAARDNSDLHPALRGFEGMRVKVEPAREFKANHMRDAWAQKVE